MKYGKRCFLQIYTALYAAASLTEAGHIQCVTSVSKKYTGFPMSEHAAAAAKGCPIHFRETYVTTV